MNYEAKRGGLGSLPIPSYDRLGILGSMNEAYQDIGLVFCHLWSDLVNTCRWLDTVRCIYAEYSSIVRIDILRQKVIHTLAVIDMDNRIPVLEGLNQAADEPLRPLRGCVDGDEGERAFWCRHIAVV